VSGSNGLSTHSSASGSLDLPRSLHIDREAGLEANAEDYEKKIEAETTEESAA
jgi:hypothetical protein